MCGLFTTTTAAEAVRQLFAVPSVPEAYAPRFKVSPGTDALVIRTAEGDREAALARWGFHPWPNVKNPPINARAETVFDNGMFKRAAAGQRCLVVVDGFFEPDGPKQTGVKRRHVHFRRSDDQPFALGGIWAKSRDAERPSFAIITTAANTLVAANHKRMPVIIGAADHALWLDRQSPAEELQPLLETRETPELISYLVTPELYKLTPDDSLAIAVAE